MYRGLSTFISDIRLCEWRRAPLPAHASRRHHANAAVTPAGKTKEAEQQRVDKELANIRKAFTAGTTMTAYDRKKYVWKLVYVNMLGYDVDFGHMEMIALVSAPSYAEKLVGYLSVSVMLRNTDEQITLVVQAIKNDLQSTQDPIQCLALAAIANLGGKELAETVAPDVQRILFSRAIFPVVRKKAALCLLRLVRISRDLLPAEEWSKKLITLLEDKHLGVVLSVVTLILGLAERDSVAYEACTGHLLVWLTRLAVNRTASEDYVYHGTVCPWLQVGDVASHAPVARLPLQFRVSTRPPLAPPPAGAHPAPAAVLPHPRHGGHAHAADGDPDARHEQNGGDQVCQPEQCGALRAV